MDWENEIAEHLAIAINLMIQSISEGQSIEAIETGRKALRFAQETKKNIKKI
jgi:hypothetical protein